jgi:lambda repressor-like predicted transcriptional regulator
MTPDEIKALVKRRGHTYESLGQEIGVSKQAIHQLVHGLSTGATGRYAFAAALDVRAEDIWPSCTPSAA